MSSFHYGSSVDSGKLERAEYNRNESFSTKVQDSLYEIDDEPIILKQLPLYFVTLKNELDKESPDSNLVSSSLCSIISTLEEINAFPFEKFKIFNVHESLIKLLNFNRREEDFVMALKIISYYSQIQEGCFMCARAGIIKGFLELVSSPPSNINIGKFAKYIFSSFSGFLKYYPGFKNDFLEKDFHKKVLYLYENNLDVQESSPIAEIIQIIKSLMLPPLDEKFIPSVMPLIDYLTMALDLHQINISRMALQAVRHLICQYPNLKNEIFELPYFDSVRNTSLQNDTPFQVFKAAIHLISCISHENHEIGRSLFTIDLFNTINQQIEYYKYRVNEMKNIMADIRFGIEHDEILASNLSYSELFQTVIDFSNDSPYHICIQSSILLCTMITSKNIEVIQKIIDTGFLSTLQQLFISNEYSHALAGMDALATIFDIIISSQNKEWYNLLKSEDWIPGSIGDLCECDDKFISQQAQSFRSAYLSHDLMSSVILPTK